MPQIPQSSDLEKKTIQPNWHVPYIPQHSIESKGRAIVGLGETISKVAGMMEDRETGLDLIKAEAEQRKGLNEIERDLMSDPDHATYDQRFNERATALNERTSQLIRNPAHRERWAVKSSAENEQVRDKILRHGIGLRRQEQADQLDGALGTHLGMIVSPDATKEQREESLGRIKTSIDVAKASGIVSPSGARNMFDKYHGAAREYMIKERIDNGDDIRDIIKDINSWGGEKVSSSSSVISMIGGHETGKKDVMAGVASWSKDSGGSVSYGNLGLNSGGSVQEFVKKYGGEFGLTAKPGTDEFNAQWEAAARSKTDKMHAAEVAWFDENISPRISSDLTSSGASEDIANDQRVKAYFADRLIQYGPNSTANHSERIKKALSESGTPEEFLRKLSEIDKEKVTKDFKTAIRTVPKNEEERRRYIIGLQNRVARREGNSLNIASTEDGGTGLSPSQRVRLTNLAKSSYRDRVLSELKDTETELKLTGQMRRNAKGLSALDRAQGILSPNQFQREKLQLLSAKAEHDAVAPLSDMSASEGDDFVDRLNPTFHTPDQKYPLDGLNPTEHYDITAKAHRLAEKKWEEIVKIRDTDPAHSVDGSREITNTKSTIRDGLWKNYTPVQGNEMMVEARLAAQTRLGIPDYQRKIVTHTEARQLLTLPNNPTDEQIDTAIKLATERASKSYGKYARKAVEDSIQLLIRSETKRDEAISSYRAVGRPPKPAEKGWFSGWFGETKTMPVPNDAQIDWVAQDPAQRSPIFDQKFGAGAYSRAVAERDLRKTK